MVVLYSVSVLIMLSIYIWSYVTDVRKSISQNLMLATMVLSNLGYLASCLATQVNEAVLAIKIIYVGECFLPMLYFLVVCGVCHTKLRRRYICLLATVQLLLYCIVCTTGYLPWFYDNVRIATVNGSHMILKNPGAFFFLYPVTMILYFVASLGTIVWAMFKKNSINNKELFYMLACSGLTVICFTVSGLMQFQFDIMPLAYCFLMVGTLIPIYHSNLFTVQENQDIIHEQLSRVAFVTFDKRMQYMGANAMAVEIFPELTNLQVGHRLGHTSDELGTLLADLQKFCEEKHPEKQKTHIHQKFKTIKIGGAYYDTVIHTLHDFQKRLVGYTVELNDETDHHNMVEMTERYNQQLSDTVEIKTNRIREIQAKTILGMAQMVESRDLSTGGHIKRTSDVVQIFVNRILDSDYSISPRFLKLVVRSAPMHDLGKIGVDDAILRKRGRFLPDEYEEMKKHAAIGGKMVKDILTDVEDESFVRIAGNVANYHHERYDGTGYPEGLVGDNIPVEARIMALADVFDALVSKRCYKDAYSFDQAFSIIEEGAGTHFDQKLTEIFLQCRPELEAYYTQCEKESENEIIHNT